MLKKFDELFKTITEDIAANDVFTIPTELDATDMNLEICNSILGQLSDGIWENSTRMDIYWKYEKFIEKDGKIWLEITNNHQYSFSISPLEFYANKLKQIVKIFLKDNNMPASLWSRTNTTAVVYLGYKTKPTIADAYRVYDTLKGRNTEYNFKKAEEQLQEKIDELNKKKEAEIKEIEAKYEKMINDLKK